MHLANISFNLEKVGSPTALADQQVEDSLRKAANIHGLYIPAGALWGGHDIQKMADRGTLKVSDASIVSELNPFFKLKV